MISIFRTSRTRNVGIRFFACGLLAILATSLPVAASVIYTTGLGSGNDPAYDTSGLHKDVGLSENGLGQYLMLADPFSLAADSTATDLLVPLSLAAATGTFSHGPELDFFIVPDSTGSPESDSTGNPIGALYSGAATPITGAGPAIYDVSLSGSATLTAGTTYWLLAKTPGTSPGASCSISSPCPYTIDEWYNNYSSTKASGYLSSDLGTGWTYVANPTMAFTIEGSASADTPEPASFALLSVGLIGVLLVSGGLRRKGAVTPTGPTR